MSDEILYDRQVIDFLEELWGEGFLSPGGVEEVARVVEGVDLKGKHILDIGCGSGAIAVLLAGEMEAGKVTGIDVEAPVCEAARQRVRDAGLEGRVEIIEVSPGPMPFDAEMFDVVFSKDSIIHIPDKATLAAEVLRVLKPGGVFAASDWLTNHDGDMSPEMAHYVKMEDLEFQMASPAKYRVAMEEAGFEAVELVNRNPWYAQVSAAELAELTGPNRAKWEARHGADFIKHQIEIWDAMQPVLKSGEHCPHHIRGRKPE
ncbi:class I SAM-dependent methyltransferase [Falsiruegeria mediterranea]|uniref:Demethylrebeccamycin-D-glucose O-methyltransferase n=1 Tax=Falsiruegeria mediterranea M17 TaxID=1200281 RepID=A0A2R8CDT7_9RHOB|nr:class I SAM-dependent methyltransferase [Falsiruegeria mediterranea]SPJ30610.1 Demethylrebeccamycin-D-glucose O-methyltransferase [Falsiruegeria mediterranea M17]